MTKTTSRIPTNFIYDANRKSAHYSLDGQHYMNGGEFAEVLDKMVRGFEATKDANTPFDKGSDIEETHTSIKSNGCGLTDRKLADNREDFLAKYFDLTASTNVDYVIILDEEINIYNMDMNEFKDFCNEFARWDKYSMKVRIKTTATMVRWLEEKIA